jgi:hypothetical protein
VGVPLKIGPLEVTPAINFGKLGMGIYKSVLGATEFFINKIGL